MMTLPQYLEWQKLTQAQFAQRIGVTQGEVSKLCSDKVSRRPSWDVASRIEAATGGNVPVSVWSQAKTTVSAA